MTSWKRSSRAKDMLRERQEMQDFKVIQCELAYEI